MHHDAEEGSAQYAEGGSLARELAREKEAEEGKVEKGEGKREPKPSELAHTIPT